jgi:hypothetical protein
MTANPTKLNGAMMTDEQKIELAAKFGIGPHSALGFAKELLSASKPAVPLGWRLVPVHPDSAMKVAGALINETGFDFAHAIYAAMLAAAPAAPLADAHLPFTKAPPSGSNLLPALTIEDARSDEQAALPRYTEWLHLRTHGEWSDGVPTWARDHDGRMNDMTAASAVIEELAARSAQAASTTASALTDDVRSALEACAMTYELNGLGATAAGIRALLREAGSASADAEIVALKHDLERHIAIASEEATRAKLNAKNARMTAIKEAHQICLDGVKWSPEPSKQIQFYIDGTCRRLAAEISSLAASTKGVGDV